MVIQEQKRMSLEAFDRFVDHPDHADRLFEYIAGRVIEVPSNPYASEIAVLIATFINLFVLKQGLGRVTGADGGYMVGGDRYAPDVAFVSKDKQARLANKGYNPLPPDLAVEVISDPASSQEHEDLRRKITNYLLVGTVVWVFNWQKEEAEVYTPGQPVQVYTKAETIPGGDVLPNFTLKLTDVYRD